MKSLPFQRGSFLTALLFPGLLAAQTAVSVTTTVASAASGGQAVTTAGGVASGGTVSVTLPPVTTPVPPITTPVPVGPLKPQRPDPVTVAAPAPGVAAAAPLVNLSTRITLAGGQTFTSGFVVGGTARHRVLIRAVGPGLAKFGLKGLSDPYLSVAQNGTVITANDDWDGGASTSALFAAVGAFPLDPASNDAVVVVTLDPGAYTVKVGAFLSTDTGEVLLEIYFID